ncbi:MAG TPA: DMT family protein [Bacteroidia bacterium]|nr:DMT family protein [Bacteroidia bacterium]HRH09129.1 DMT family protein [Bacteroidia bacterium]HRH63977.1 DMT family protein [Bacteroidia bacterium]
MRGIYTILLLVLSNLFMTLAWYGHLQVKKISWMQGAGLLSLILVSWGLAFFEYIFQVPANRIGFNDNGGPFNLFQLKIIQEVISITVFTVFAVYIFKTDKLSLNYIIGFIFMILAVYFIFKK